MSAPLTITLSAFALVVPAHRAAAPALVRAPAARMVDIPRVTLPDALGSALADADLNNPNELSQADYNTYSGAAIGGTLALFLPGALIFDITGVIGDFAVSALLGGGLGAALALSNSGVSDAANGVGAKLLEAAGGIDIPRVTLPDAVGDVLKDVDFKNPNSLSQADYNTYSGAAIAGTLALFLPLLLVFDVSGFVLDFVLSALLGGGLGAGLALSKGGASDAANKFGATVLSTVDKVL